MLRPKRISKPPTSFSDLQVPPSRKNSKLNKKRALTRAEFKPLPQPLQFNYITKTYFICGDIILNETNGIISSDMSLISKMKVFKSIVKLNIGDAKCIQILLSNKDGPVVPADWRELVKNFEASDSKNLNDWAKIVTRFCTQHEEVVKMLTERGGKLAQNESEEAEYARMTKETEELKMQLFSKYPSFCFRCKYGDNMIQFNEMLFNELYIKDIGHTVDSMVSEIFDKGLPQVSSYDSETGSKIMKEMFSNYFDLSKGIYVGEETCISLHIKENYTKNIYLKQYLLKNFEDGSLGVDVIFAVIRKEDVYMEKEKKPEKVLTQEFINEMAKQEKTKAEFLSDFYNSSFTLRYTHIEKVCGVKELPVDEESLEQ